MATFYCSTKRHVISSVTSAEVVPVGTNEYILKEQDTPRCGTCKYWLSFTESNIMHESMVGHCKRYPPKLDRGFVSTHKEEWCGEYVDKCSPTS